MSDYINLDNSTLSYCPMDEAYAILNLLDTGALMSKINLKNAFHLIPVHPSGWNLLRISWHNKFCVTTCLPFGLCFAPILFNQLSVQSTGSYNTIHHYFRLTKEAHLDMYWWLDFLPQWSSTSCILEIEWTTTTSMNMYTDASGALGWRAYWWGRWLQVHWSLNDCKKDTVWKEQLQLTDGATTGSKRLFFSTVTTNPSVISGAGVLQDHQKLWS